MEPQNLKIKTPVLNKFLSSGIWDVGAKPEAGDGDRILVTAYVTVAAGENHPS